MPAMNDLCAVLHLARRHRVRIQQRRSARRFVAWQVVFILTVAAMSVGAQDADAETKSDRLHFEGLAPKNTIAFFTIDDYSDMRRRMEATPVIELWREPSIQDWLRVVFTKPREATEEAIEPLGLKLADLPQPSGLVGLALWADELAASPMIAHMLFAAEFGEGADRFDDAIDALVQRATTRNQARASMFEIAGVSIRAIELPDKDAGARTVMIGARTIFVARLGDLFLVCTEKTELARVIERAAGRTGDAYGELDEMIAARQSVGAAHFYAAIQAQPALEAIARAIRSDVMRSSGSLLFDPRSMFDALGLSPIRSISYAVEFDAPEAPLVSRLSMRVPNRDGFVSLFDVPGGVFDPPSFIAANATGVRLVRFKIPGLIPALIRAVQSIPPERRLQTRAMIDFMVASIGPILENLGPDVVTTRLIRHPYDAESAQSVFAVRSGNPTAVATLLSRLGAIAGLQNRVHLGQRMWTMSSGKALAFVSSYLLSASVGGAEDAISNVVQRDVAPLTESPSFREAREFTAPGGIYYAYINLRAAMEFIAWREKNWEQILRERLRGENLSDAELQESVELARQERAARTRPTFPPADGVLRHMGDIVGETHVTQDGFFYRGAWFSARE